MVRLITIDELSAVASLGPKFYAEAGLPGRFIPEVFARKWATFFEMGAGFILGLFKDGAIAGAFGAIVSDDLNDGTLVANECFWFVIPESRGRGFELLIAYEEEARRRGAKRCSMIHLANLQPEKLAHIYEKRGYREVETSYSKELN